MGRLQVGFIDRHLFHTDTRGPNEAKDFSRFRAVLIHPGRKKHSGRTEPGGGAARHGGPDPKLPGLIARGTHHTAAFGRTPDNHRPSLEPG